MPDTAPALASSIRRVIARDDLLMLAREVQSAVAEAVAPTSAGLSAHPSRTRTNRAERIATSTAAKPPVYRDESTLFSAALGMHLHTAENTLDPTIAVHSRVKAMNIALFSRLTDVELDWPSGVDESTPFGDAVLATLRETRDHSAGEEIDADPYTGVIARLQAIRAFRCAGDLRTAIDEADRPDKAFAGTGADFYRAHYQFELAAALLLDGRSADVTHKLAASEFWTATATYKYPARHRYEYALALGHWARGESAAALDRLAGAQRLLNRARGSGRGDDVAELIIALARADLLLGEQCSFTNVNAIADLLAVALDTAERVRDRWGVVSRSRNPLSVAFRRVYGDIARIAAATPGRQAAELGFRAALAAKRTGFAGVIRRERTMVHGRRLRSLIEQVVDAENKSDASVADLDDADDAARQLSVLRVGILENVSPMLADLILPDSVDTARVVDGVGARYALDFVGLPDTLTGTTTWYRTLIEPSGALVFESLPICPALEVYLRSLTGPTSRLVDYLVGHPRPDWRALGANLLPARLTAVLTATDEDNPVDVVISAHGQLSLVPWAALRLDDGGRFIERAVIAQSPVLSCLSGPDFGGVEGAALVHLVDGPRGVETEAERRAWGIPAAGAASEWPVRCEIGFRATSVALTGSFADELGSGTWGFGHIACHGSGTGLGQTLDLPGRRISAGLALTLRWPESVLMASCDVGRLMNIEDAEPVNFVTALLAGGSRCVVACIDEVPDDAAGEIAEAVVTAVRNGGVRLEAALRTALLPHRQRMTEARWSMVSAYTR